MPCLREFFHLFIAVVSIVGGLVALVVGGELLVRGASSLALAARVAPLVIGLTVVAFGTSAPELAVSVQSCREGVTGLAIGNAVGSNISNILLVLGASAIAVPLAVHSRLFRLDIPVMIVTAAALWAMGQDGEISRIEGGVLVATLVAYFYWTIKTGRREQRLLEAELEDMPSDADGISNSRAVVVAVVQVVAGLVLLVGGADYLVAGCSTIAKMFGISDLVIGLTVTAIGTSMPELVTSIMAALRGKRDLAVGNVVGSNILNILGVLGISSLVTPGGIPVDPEAQGFHIPIMVAVSACCLPIFFTGMIIARAEGIAMLTFYAAYLSYLAYSATTDPPTHPSVSTTLLFCAPLVVIALCSVVLSRRKK